MEQALTTTEAAKLIGASPSFIRRRCQEGDIPAFRIGSDFRILRQDFDVWKASLKESARKKPKAQDDQGLAVYGQVRAWVEYLTHIKALAPRTVEQHNWQLRWYLKRMVAAGIPLTGLASVFDRRSVAKVFASVAPGAYAMKYNTYNALLSFGAFLASEGLVSKVDVDAVRTVRPRRQSEPRRTSLKANHVEQLFEVVYTYNAPAKENTTFAAVVAVMLYGGLRVSEVCDLRRVDVDLVNRVIQVRHGKGGKDRRVGITSALLSYLAVLDVQGGSTERYFVTERGTPWTRNFLARRFKTISERLGVDITCHGLRRTFATLAANQGRSVNSIRIALGHSNLETTQQYLRTSEAEVVEQMKDW